MTDTERELCINKFNNIINNQELSKEIEESIYNYSIEQAKIRCIEPLMSDKFFRRIYVNKIITLYNNIDKESYIKNNHFLERLLNNEFDVKNIAFLSPTNKSL